MEPWDSASTTAKQQDENGTGGGDDTDAMETIRTAFRLIASPFVPYQRALAEAERDPLGKAASMVAKDVRSVVGLQDAADRLEDLAPFMFPLADCKYIFTRVRWGGSMGSFCFLQVPVFPFFY